MIDSKTLVIIPSYNESENIIKLINRLLTLGSKVDVLVVDDGGDNTADLVRERQIDGPRLFLIKRPGKGGRGTAVLDGFNIALARDYQFIAEMDADFSHDPDELPQLVAVADDNTLVIASRSLKGSQIVGWPITRTLLHKFANLYTNLILRMRITDYTNGYRVYGREALKKLDHSKIKGIGYIVLSEISYQLFKKGVKFREVPTLFINRRRGSSNLSLREITEGLRAVIRLKLS